MAKMKAANECLRKARLATTEWGKRIIKAEKAGSFDELDEEQAACWPDCPTGKLDGDIARFTAEQDWLLYYAPIDDKLRDLGQKFFYEVKGHLFVAAATTLIAIYNRAEVLNGTH